MTTDEKIAWAKANAGRRVSLVRGIHVPRSGVIVGCYTSGHCSTLFAEPDPSGEVIAGSDCYGPNAVVFIRHRRWSCYFDDPENFDPADGLGPLKMPGASSGTLEPQLGVGAAKPAPVRGNGVYVPRASLREQLSELRRILADTPQPWIARLAGPLGHVEVNLSALLAVYDKATHALQFLVELVPLPGWSQATERKLVDAIRELKAALHERRGQ